MQRVALDGTVLWDFHYDGAAHWSHHDLEPMPNGNVLMIAWDNKTVAEAVAAGRDPALISGTVMRADSVIEVQPTGPTTGTIVWEWHVWDHLIQDFDPTKANYGVVAAHPELVNVNYPVATASDWNHMNSVKYDPVYDRIMVSSHAQSEIWVIDHGTTTAQAAGHAGGPWGKGGDLLYRYGNPQVYGAGTAADRVFFGQHSARFIPPGYPGAGNFTVFNNDPPGGGSIVWEYTPPLDAVGNFVLAPGAAYGPAGPVWTYSAPGFDSNVHLERRAPPERQHAHLQRLPARLGFRGHARRRRSSASYIARPATRLPRALRRPQALGGQGVAVRRGRRHRHVRRDRRLAVRGRDLPAARLGLGHDARHPRRTATSSR